MTNDSKNDTATSENVLKYYSRNWNKIANCYDLAEDGLPIDPASYRRRLYKDFLTRNKPASVLDIGCGGGTTVLDALELGLDARGIEPVAELKEFGCQLLQKHGKEPSRITQNDLASVTALPAESLECIALLSVLGHVPRERWDDTHLDLARVLRRGGRVFAAYRNELFDLYTFNSFTMEFYNKSLWGCEPCTSLRTEQNLNLLKSLVTKPDMPGPYYTTSQDKTFGQLDRVKVNPLTMPSYLSKFGLKVEHTKYYHFHCVPPLLEKSVDDFRKINHQLEMTMSDDWRGNFMAAIFVVEVVKV